MKKKPTIMYVPDVSVWYRLKQAEWEAYYAAHKEELDKAEYERRMANLYRILPGLIRHG